MARIDPKNLDKSKPYKVVEIPQPLAALGINGASTRILCECKTLEDAQEARYMEDVDEPAPDKAEFRKLAIVYFVGWEPGEHRVYD